jgi:hypothetical protein
MTITTFMRREIVTETRIPAPFVVGVPRSGTTLLRLMLDSHPELVIPAETHFLPKLFRAIEDGDARRRLPWRSARGRRLRGAAGRRARRQALELITGHRRWPDWGLSEDELRARFDAEEPFGCAEAARAFFGLCAAKAGKPRWGDKSPSYRIRMRRIAPVLPEARFIHVIRDGRDVALSLMDVPWGPSTIAEAAAMWARDIKRARRQGQRVGHYMELRYEDLVAEPEERLREVAGFVDLPWDEAILAYHERASDRIGEFARDFAMRRGVSMTAAERAEQHRHTSEPPTAARTGRWREEMSADEHSSFNGEPRKLLAELGYE